MINKRSTIQRSLVLEAVRELRRHVTADEVYESIVETHPYVGRGTVYRNLKLLSDIGEIRRLSIPGGADRYDHLCHEHYHTKCDQCGRIFDVEMPFISDLEKRITERHGFHFTGHDIIFKGICLECNNVRMREHESTP